ncbi:MAG: type II toxin-antitoxin system VapB family antitoxin [Chloroflexi bacterium]|nr:type II toxin-antitoxin system VapB family antitoxin [Chloroflexota bacterium]
MATNLALDDELINEAKRLGAHKTKREAVTVALREYVQRRKQRLILEMSGTVSYDAEYDYKTERWRR